jgi:hypothetical protein
MSPDTTHKTTKRGDVVTVAGHHVGEPQRVGEILDVLGDPGHNRYRVRWDDGHESIFYPSSDAVIKHKASTRKKKS